MHGSRSSGSNKSTNRTVSHPASRSRCSSTADSGPVTPGNRAAAVVAGLNVVIFSVIAVLAHREELQRKRGLQLPESLFTASDNPRASVECGIEKQSMVGVRAVETTSL